VEGTVSPVKSAEHAPGRADAHPGLASLRYVLITAARNEEAFIRKTLESVVRQSMSPVRWVIVDDGSSDRTADMVASYAKHTPWIDLVSLPPRRERHFAGKVHAFNTGLERVKSIQFDLVANLDADVSLEPDHFEFLIQKFAEDETLGVAGTAYTQPGYYSVTDSFEGQESVAGPLQVFRYECFREIGGYVPNRLGGIDWIAVTTARMKGWKTCNFIERRFHHHRLMGTAQRGALGAAFDYGEKDYFLGRSPIWQLCRCGYRMTKRPFLLGGLALLTGYSWAALRRMDRAVGPDVMAFHRREQMAKLKHILGSMIRLRRVEKFYRPL
jgi:glycosyltransferase involved in cell wall biosynthesis